jgi:hypothetical protein
MKPEWKNGLLGGLILSVFSISGNAFRNDSHLVNLFPDVLAFIIFAVVLFYSIRACKSKIVDSPNPQRAFTIIGMKVTLGCAIVLTITLTIYELLIGFRIWLGFILFVPLVVLVVGLTLTRILWTFRSKIFHDSSATA